MTKRTCLRVFLFQLAAGIFIPAIAQAETFMMCVPHIMTNDAKDKAWAEKACDAENAVYAAWDKKLSVLDIAQQDLMAAANAGNWDAFRSKMAETLPLIKELQAAALENREAAGSMDIISLYSADIGYFFQNVGLGMASGLDDAITKIQAALDTPKANAAATIWIQIVRQSVSRGNRFVVGLGKSANDGIKREQKSEDYAYIEARKDKMEGGSIDGYFGGFGERIKAGFSGLFGTPFITMLIVGIRAFKKARLKMIPKAGVLSFGIMTGFVPVFIFFPWVSVWYVNWALVGLFAYLWFVSEKWTIWGGFFRTQTSSPAVGIGILGTGGVATPRRPITHGSARWSTPAEMVKHGHLIKRSEALAEPGLVLGRVPGISGDYDNRFRIGSHVLTFAPTGSGKGIGAVLPNLLEYPGSVFALDIKGENYAVTAKARRELLGNTVFLLDPFGITGDTSHSINPLDRLDVNNPDVVGDSSAIADMLVITSQQEKGNHWNDSAKDLIRGLMVYVVGLDDPDRHNLGEVRRLLTTGHDEWADTLAEMAVSDIGFGVVSRAANVLLSKPKDERGSVISTAQRHTAFLDDPRIAAALSRSDFSFDQLKTGLITVYLAMPLEKLETQARFVRSVFGAAQSAVMATPVKPRYKVLFLLDEFGQLGYMPSVESGISLIRGYGGIFWLFFQDLGQLKPIYPKWQSLMANAAKHFYGTADNDTAKYICESLGKATIEFETQSKSKNSGHSFGGSIGMNSSSGNSDNRHYTGRDLLTLDEVMRLGSSKPLVLISGEAPTLLDRIAYYNDPDYREKAAPNPYHTG